MLCLVMSEGQPVNLEKCTLSRSILDLKKPCTQNFMLIDPRIQIFPRAAQLIAFSFESLEETEQVDAAAVRVWEAAWRFG